ncbi:thiol-disulfide oxidoreductase DCC family protein [Alteribacillus sp. HJP-4]|uniref:thiol-disulfide oxidoreductase DCC family protein n=1 Tax=Alteribacillus sp. HJP-4 TaxID=2775394 RepID=UPI0035CCD0E6
MKKNHSYFVFYDGNCALCQKTKHQIEKLDKNYELEWHSIQNPSILEEFPFLEQDRIQKEMHLLVDETYLYTGFASIKRMMQVFPASRIITPLFRLPGADTAGRIIYQYLAKNRYQWFGRTCETGACSIHE